MTINISERLNGILNTIVVNQRAFDLIEDALSSTEEMNVNYFRVLSNRDAVDIDMYLNTMRVDTFNRWQDANSLEIAQAEFNLIHRIVEIQESIVPDLEAFTTLHEWFQPIREYQESVTNGSLPL